MRSTPHTPGRLLLTYLRPQGWTVVVLAVLIVGTITLQLVNPQIVRTILDGAQVGRPLAELINLAALFMALALTRQFLQLAGTYVGEVVAWTATNALRADLALHCLKLDMGFHKRYKPGELIERVDGDVNQLATFFSELVIRLSANLLLCVGALALLWAIDWTIGAAITAVMISGYVMIRYLNTLAIPRVQALRGSEATLFGYIEEWLSGTETIRSSGAEPFIMRRLSRLLRDWWQRAHALMKLTMFLSSVPRSVFSLSFILIFTLGSWRFFDGLLSLGTLYITFYYIELLNEPLWQLTRQIEELQRALASINRINELMAEQPTIVDRPQTRPLPAAPQGMQIDFDDLTFAYADEPDTPILHHIDLTLKPGTVVGLLGRTGSGKTTLTKLLLRFYDPVSGAIRLGDGQSQIDVRDVAQVDLRRQIGVVTQQVQLFNASVRDSVTMFDPAVSDEAITNALAEVGLDRWLADLPDGLDSYLAAEGGLSAGQAQLLAFARIFLMDPGLIILDEASSRLDPATEQLIEHALDRLLTNRTVVIVAHRLATVMRADEIMILDGGRIAEHGRREALLSDPDSRFAQLLKTGLEEAIG